MPSLYIALQQELPGVESPDFVETLKEWFEDVGEECGHSLMRFFGQDPAEFFDEDEGDIEVGARWFEPAEGIATIDALLEAIQDDPSSRAEAARAELIEMRGVLETAHRHKVPFHIALDI